jgi:proteic killer suppression protein
VIYSVRKSKALEKQIRKGQLPDHILTNLNAWAESVEADSLEQTRKIPGYHDEPCRGDLGKMGWRSIRLAKGWRGYYTVKSDGRVEFVQVERVDKHEYGK